MTDSLFLIIVCALYMAQAFVLFKRGDYALSWMFFGYVIANIGLIVRYW